MSNNAAFLDDFLSNGRNARKQLPKDLASLDDLGTFLHDQSEKYGKYVMFLDNASVFLPDVVAVLLYGKKK